MSDRVVIRSGREFCERFFPRAHAARKCLCHPKPKGSVLVIQPRRGKAIR